MNLNIRTSKRMRQKNIRTRKRREKEWTKIRERYGESMRDHTFQHTLLKHFSLFFWGGGGGWRDLVSSQNMIFQPATRKQWTTTKAMVRNNNNTSAANNTHTHTLSSKPHSCEPPINFRNACKTAHGPLINSQLMAILTRCLRSVKYRCQPLFAPKSYCHNIKRSGRVINHRSGLPQRPLFAMIHEIGGPRINPTRYMYI